MATNFPASLDSLTNPTSSDSLNSPSHSAQHANVNDAVEALQAKVGADSSAVTSSLDYKVATLENAPTGRRNLLYNGAMQVAQRGTSSTVGTPSIGYYTADRWMFVNTIGTWTQSVENDAPAGSGFHKSLKMLCTTADASPASGGYCLLQQIIEGQDAQLFCKGTGSAKQATLSFWVKSNTTGTYVIELRDIDNSRQVSKTFTVNASATWEYKTIVYPADTIGSLDNDNGASLSVFIWLAAGSTYSSGTLNTSWGSNIDANRAVGQTNLASAVNNYWQITGVQLEVGDKATPFEHRTYGEELTLCQRYYQRNTANGTDRPFAVGVMLSSTQPLTYYGFPTMRSAPTFIFSGVYDCVVGGAAPTATSLTAFNTENNSTQINATTGSGTQGHGAVLRQDSGYFDLSAEF